LNKEHLTPFSFTFNGSLRVETRGYNLSPDAGAFILRELEDKLDLVKDLAERIEDPRNPDCITHPMVELLRARLFALALGYTDQDDLDFLRDDPILRLGVSVRRGTKPLDEPDEEENVPDGLASQPTQSRLVKTLSSESNLDVLNDTLAEWAARSFPGSPVRWCWTSTPSRSRSTVPSPGRRTADTMASAASIPSSP